MRKCPIVGSLNCTLQDLSSDKLSLLPDVFSCEFTLVSNPDPSLSRSAGCIASPAHGRKGLATLARFSCAFGMQLKL